MTKQYADLIPGLADLARNLVRDLDPQVGPGHMPAVRGVGAGCIKEGRCQVHVGPQGATQHL